MTRITVSVGLLDRPLVVGFVLGLITGRMDIALPLAVVLELFWLDVIRLGSVVPPSGVMPLFLLFSLTLLLKLDLPADLPLPFLLCLPFAYSVSWLEKCHRQQANVYVDSVAAWCSGGRGLSPESVVARSVFKVIWSHFVLYMIAFAAVYSICALLLAYGSLPHVSNVSWNLFYGLGLMGAILALRIRRAYMVLGFGLVLVIYCHM